jgi:serine acetyltransferase
MKTSPLDFLLIGTCVTLLLALSGLTVSLLPLSGVYEAILGLAAFLLAYGVYTMTLLGLLRKFRPYPIGKFSMSSSAFTYWKLNAVLVDLAWKALGPFNTVFSEALFCSGLGAKIGGQIAIAGDLRDHPILWVGDRATIGQNAVITGHAMTHNEIVIKPIRLGRGSVVGINCVVMPGVELGENAVLAPGGVAIMDTKIPPNELWGGIPARKIKDLSPPE